MKRRQIDYSNIYYLLYNYIEDQGMFHTSEKDTQTLFDEQSDRQVTQSSTIAIEEDEISLFKKFQELMAQKAEGSNTAIIPSSQSESDTFIPTGNSRIKIQPETMQILTAMLKEEDFETGIENPSEKYFRKLFDSDRLSAIHELNELFMNNYELEQEQVHILIGILHIISHFDYHEVYPEGQSMAINGVSHKNKEVEEYAIKCFENWNDKDGVRILKSISFSAPWLQEYADDVIQVLEEGE